MEYHLHGDRPGCASQTGKRKRASGAGVEAGFSGLRHKNTRVSKKERLGSKFSDWTFHTGKRLKLETREPGQSQGTCAQALAQEATCLSLSEPVCFSFSSPLSGPLSLPHWHSEKPSEQCQPASAGIRGLRERQ